MSFGELTTCGDVTLHQQRLLGSCPGLQAHLLESVPHGIGVHVDVELIVEQTVQLLGVVDAPAEDVALQPSLGRFREDLFSASSRRIDAEWRGSADVAH